MLARSNANKGANTALPIDPIIAAAPYFQSCLVIAIRRFINPFGAASTDFFSGCSGSCWVEYSSSEKTDPIDFLARVRKGDDLPRKGGNPPGWGDTDEGLQQRTGDC